MSRIELFADDYQKQIVETTREILRRDFSFNTLAKRPVDPADEDRKWDIAASSGWIGCGLPEDLGGAQLGAAEQVLIFRELGRALAGLDVMASLLAAQIVAVSNPAEATAFATGRQRAGLAFSTGHDPRSAGSVSVIGLETASQVVWLSGNFVSLLPRDAFENVREGKCIDPTLTLSHCTVRPSRMGDMVSAAKGFELHATLLLVAKLVGIAEAARDMAVTHAKFREQFGQPIGAFQAVAHHCVDMELRSQAAFSQLLFAAIAWRDRRPDAAFQIRAAALVGGDAAFRNATMNIRVLGGMGYSEESGAHLYLKRALVLRSLVGPDFLTQAALLSENSPL